MREVVSEDYEQVTIGRIASNPMRGASMLGRSPTRALVASFVSYCSSTAHRQSVGLGMVDAVCAIGVARLYDFQTVEE
jgi:hypothetical protein